MIDWANLTEKKLNEIQDSNELNKLPFIVESFNMENLNLIKKKKYINNFAEIYIKINNIQKIKNLNLTRKENLNNYSNYLNLLINLKNKKFCKKTLLKFKEILLTEK